MATPEQELYDQLVGYLAAEGEVVENAADGIIVRNAFDHRHLDPPLRLHLTPSSLGDRLRESSDSAGLALSELPTLEAA